MWEGHETEERAVNEGILGETANTNGHLKRYLEI